MRVGGVAPGARLSVRISTQVVSAHTGKVMSVGRLEEPALAGASRNGDTCFTLVICTKGASTLTAKLVWMNNLSNENVFLSDPGKPCVTESILVGVRCASENVMLTLADGVWRVCSTCWTVIGKIVEIATAETLAESLVPSVRIPHL